MRSGASAASLGSDEQLVAWEQERRLVVVASHVVSFILEALLITFVFPFSAEHEMC